MAYITPSPLSQGVVDPEGLFFHICTILFYDEINQQIKILDRQSREGIT